jgi:dTDP-4-dehydrorhamnose reductase
MRVMVTGAGGLLGAAVCRAFAPHVDLHAFDRARLELTDATAVGAAVSAVAPDLVINCAAFNDVDGAEDRAPEALAVNAFAVLSLARAAHRAGARLVHYSTDFVFDGLASEPYTEEDPPRPQSTYGASKLLGDWFALEESRAWVLRVESLFGDPRSSGGRRGSLGTLVDKIKSGAEVPVFVDRTVSPACTVDVARATRELVAADAPPGIYNCVNSGFGTWADVAAEAARLLGVPLHMRPLTLETAGLKARRPRFCALSNEKLARAGVRMPDWRDALARYVAGQS